MEAIAARFSDPIKDDKSAREFIAFMDDASHFKKLQGTAASLLAMPFDYATHSLQALYLLTASSGNESVREQWAARTAEFLSKFNSSVVHFATKKFGVLANAFAKYMMETDRALAQLKILLLAVKRLQRAPGQLTPLHATFLKLCLKCRQYSYALQLLDQPITSVVEDKHVDSLDVLTYFYYGGLVHVGLKQFENAIHCFMAALSVPSEGGVSAVAVAAYQRLVLVSLIQDGEVVSLPKFMNQSVRLIKILCTPYSELAAAFSQPTVEGIDKVLERHRTVFNSHRTTGLARQCRQSFFHQKIRRLTKTFVTLSLADIASRVGLAGPHMAEDLLLSMIDKGIIEASINQLTGVVSFAAQTDEFDDEETMARLNARIAYVAQLTDRVHAGDAEMQLSRQYVLKQILPDTSIDMLE